MPLARAVALREVDVGSSGTAGTGQRSTGGAMRSATRSSARNGRRKSPYDKKASPGPPTTGLSSELGGMTLRSATRSLGFDPARLPSQVVVSDRGAGGAAGPIERQRRKEAAWRAKLEKEEAVRRETSLVAAHLGGRSVDEWRGSAIDGFLSNDQPPLRSQPKSQAPNAHTALARSWARSTTAKAAKDKALPPLPPLPRTCAQARKLRLKPAHAGLGESP